MALLLDEHDALSELGIGRTTLWQLTKSGEIQSIKIGRRRLYPRAALERYIEGRLQAEQAEAATR